MPQYINVKHSVASVTMQYNLVPMKAVGVNMQTGPVFSMRFEQNLYLYSYIQMD